jgi:hypothetical protein
VQNDPIGRVVECKEVGEGPADIDTDHPGHLLPALAKTDLAGMAGGDQSIQSWPWYR